MPDAKIISLSVFALAYLLFIILPNKRSYVAISGVLALLVAGVLTPHQAFFFVNWNVMGIFIGTLAVADIFMESRLPAYLAELIVEKAKNTGWAIVLICILTGVISAFIENVATVLIVAPIAIELARKLKINPTKTLIAIAISSNLQGTATLIGDPPSMLLAGFAKMSFLDFFIYQGKPSIFFAVELGALASFVVLYFIFRKLKEKLPLVAVKQIKSLVPAGILVSLIACLAVSSFFDKEFSYLAGTICLIFGFISLIWRKFFSKIGFRRSLRALDWDTGFFLIGVFVIVGAIVSTGWIETLSITLSNQVGSNPFIGYTLLVLIAVIFSAFIDNVPFLITMLPVALSMAQRLNVAPQLFLFGLLIGASLGGNITPIGASANIVACGLLKKEGYPVRFKEFIKIGLPFTLAAVAAAYLFIWFVWKT